MHTPIALTLLSLVLVQPIIAREIHVSLDGDDRATGTADAPVRSLHRAQELSRMEDSTARVVVLHDGRWHVESGLNFGTADSDVTWRAKNRGRATISGGRLITGWKPNADGTWSTTIETVRAGQWFFRELFVNGRRATRARTPNDGYFRIEQAAADKRTGFSFRDGDVRNVPDLDQVELVFLHDWSITRVGIRSIEETNHTLVTSNPIGANARHYAIDWFEEHPRYFLENSAGYLDQPGEWFLNPDTGELRYHPRADERIGTAEVIAPVASRLIQVRGSEGERVRNLRFDGIHFEHCAWQIPENGYAEGQANYHEPRTQESGILREIIPAAIQIELAENCAIRHGQIAHMGGGGVWIGSRTENCALSHSLVFDISGNGALVGEDQGRSVGGNNWWRVHPEEAASNNRIESCEIREVGQQYFGAVGIWVGFTQGTRILHNEIHHTPYTGISLGWMWNPTPTPAGNNLVDGNHIHHVMQILSDGGGIYTLGRQPGTVLRNNMIHDVPVNLGRAESNGMFLDEGTTEIVIENNAIYNIDRSPLRFHRATTNIVRNNLLVVKEGVPHIRYNNTNPEDIRQVNNTIAVSEMSGRATPQK